MGQSVHRQMSRRSACTLFESSYAQRSCASSHRRASRSWPRRAYLAALVCPVGDHPAQTFPVALIDTRAHVAEPAATRHEVYEQARTEVAVFARKQIRHVRQCLPRKPHRARAYYRPRHLSSCRRLLAHDASRHRYSGLRASWLRFTLASVAFMEKFN